MILGIGMLLALQVTVRGVYVLRDTGNCNGCIFIDSSDECALAARELGLNDVNVDSASRSYYPYGCYYRPGEDAGERLYFNPNGDQSDSDATRVSICVQDPGNNGHNFCSQGEPPSVTPSLDPFSY